MRSPGAALALILLIPWALTPANAHERGSLEVHVTYTGLGTVDAKHKIYVVVWDYPDFDTQTNGAAPIAAQSTSSKHEQLNSQT